MQFKESHIALFPLNLFLLPGDYTQLYIFEDRYKQLIKDCLTEKMNFGIAFSNRSNLKSLGSLVEVTEVIREYPGGEMDIMIKAVSIFQLEKFYFQKEGKLYPEGKIRHFDVAQNHTASPALIRSFKDYLIRNSLYDSQLLNISELGIFGIANEMHMSDQEKMELVNLGLREDMEHYLKNYIRYLELLQLQEKNVFQNIYLN